MNVADYVRTLAVLCVCVSVLAGNTSLRITPEKQSCMFTELYISQSCSYNLDKQIFSLISH